MKAKSRILVKWVVVAALVIADVAGVIVFALLLSWPLHLLAFSILGCVTGYLLAIIDRRV